MRFGPLLLVFAAAAAADDALVSRGYEDFYNLQYDQALQRFNEYAAAQPEDPEAYNHIAHTILYRNLFRAGALETEMVTGNNPFLRRSKVEAPPEDVRAFDENIRRAMSIAQSRIDRNPRDTMALYAIGVSYGLRANYNFLVRKAWRDALHDASAARKAHDQVIEIDPAFTDARLVPGLHDYVVGSLPVHWRVISFLAGFHGDKDKGIHEVELVANKGKSNRIDAEFLLCAIYRREHEPQLAVALLEQLVKRFPLNYLLRMELAQMHSDLREPAKALAALAQVRAMKKAGAPGYRTLPVEKICYAEGTVQFWYRDFDAALANMKRVTAKAEELDLNTGVLAWMRIGQIYDLKGQRSRALEAYRHAISFAPDSDAAKESRTYLATPYKRRSKA